jgi:hypothetical protein
VEEAAELHGTAGDICCPCGNEPVPVAASGQAHQWPQEQRDARYQRAEAARQDEKKKVFHAAILFLQRRRLSRQSVPAISRLRSRLAANLASDFSRGTWRGCCLNPRRPVASFFFEPRLQKRPRAVRSAC